MTIGKRKGFTSKGAGAAPGNDSNKKVGGSLSKSDHFYLQEAYGLIGDTGIADTYMDASGGTVSDWADPGGNSYRTHVFTATGTFTVNEEATGTLPNAVDWAVIAGGASGGGHYGGGGGAGGFRSSLISPGGNAADPSPGGEAAITVSTGQAYTITVGAGGATAPAHAGLQGGNSSISHPSITDIICNGGGGGGSLSPNPNYPYGPGIAGGSGGGGADKGSNPNAGGASSTPPGAPTITQGYAGGSVPNTPGSGGYEAGGGGGARYVGQGGIGGNPGAGGHGGLGVNLADMLGPTNTSVGYVGPNTPPAAPTPDQWFAGGGGGGGYHSAGNTGGEGGTFPNGWPSPWCGAGGGGAWPTGAGSAALMNSGSGGGGVGPGDPHNPLGGHAGGSGIVMFRYRVGSVGGTKATGGLVSHTPTRTIHTFLETGTFTVTSPTLTSIQYLVIGGGGSGGVNLVYNQGTGGGGAGGLRTSFTGDVPGGPGGSTENAVPVTVAAYTMTVGAGGNGGGLPNNNPGASGSSSTLNYNGGTIVAQGGGGGGSRASSQPSPGWRNGAHGGCGGGGSGLSLIHI